MRGGGTLIFSCSACFCFLLLLLFFKWTSHQWLIFRLFFTVSLVVPYKFILHKTTIITWSWKVCWVLSLICFLRSFTNLEVIEFTLKALYFFRLVFHILTIIGCVIWKIFFTPIKDHTRVYGLVQKRVIELCLLVLIKIIISFNIWGNVRDSWWLIRTSHLIHLSVEFRHFQRWQHWAIYRRALIL